MRHNAFHIYSNQLICRRMLLFEVDFSTTKNTLEVTFLKSCIQATVTLIILNCTNTDDPF